MIHSLYLLTKIPFSTMSSPTRQGQLNSCKLVKLRSMALSGRRRGLGLLVGYFRMRKYVCSYLELLDKADSLLEDGDPSQDVAVASVLFLVDGKLGLLQPTTTESGDRKYDMRIVAHNVEYYVLMRDQIPYDLPSEESTPPTPSLDAQLDGDHPNQGIKDSLWTFNGVDLQVWPDVQDILKSASIESTRALSSSVQVSVDFYPLSVLLSKGVILGIESELVQRRDVTFALFRLAMRVSHRPRDDQVHSANRVQTHLFLPHLLLHHLSHYNSPAALRLAHHYQHLSYFPHALEMLLHTILDEEVDKAPSPEDALLPSILNFLSSFPEYLDILVQCTRKTELRSWRTLFSYLPPPQELFEQSLQKGLLKTAGGYLLVLHTFEELNTSSQQLVRLLRRAKEEEDWELCKELARFLMALDESGTTLREALEMVELKSPGEDGRNGGFPVADQRQGLSQLRVNGIGLGIGVGTSGSRSLTSSGSRSPLSRGPSDNGSNGTSDYFSMPVD